MFLLSSFVVDTIFNFHHCIDLLTSNFQHRLRNYFVNNWAPLENGKLLWRGRANSLSAYDESISGAGNYFHDALSDVSSVRIFSWILNGRYSNHPVTLRV